MRLARAFAVLSLLALGCQTNTLGGTCTVDTNCDYGQLCFPADAGQWADGFCSRGCTITGSELECPSSSICSQDGVTSTVFCTHPCSTDTDCRDGYHCNAITGSSTKGCGN